MEIDGLFANLARRLSLSVDDMLRQIAARPDLMDHIAAVLEKPVVMDAAPLKLLPVKQVSDDAALIISSGKMIATALSAPEQAFIDAVRALGYRWDNGQWQRTIRPRAEPLMDRAVELGVHILAAGFPVIVRSQELYDRIAASDYAPEIRTWVEERTTGKFAGWFCISWPRDDERYYRAVRLINGSRIYPGSALIPRERFDEVLDFADSHGFSVSDGARALAEKARHERAALLVVEPQERTQKRKPKPQQEPNNADILDELVDHDDTV